MDPRSIAPRPPTLALLVAALFLSALSFRLIPEPPERDVLGRESAIAHLREMLARMPTDDTVAVRPWRQVSLDEEVQYMNREEADRVVAGSTDLARRSCPSEREDYFGWDQCHDRYAKRVFGRADAQADIAQLQSEISNGRAKTWGFGAVGLLLALGACWLAARLGREVPPVAVDLAQGEAPGDALAKEQGLLVTCHIAAWTVALLLLVWSQVFVGWLGLLEGRGLTVRDARSPSLRLPRVACVR